MNTSVSQSESKGSLFTLPSQRNVSEANNTNDTNNHSSDLCNSCSELIVGGDLIQAFKQFLKHSKLTKK